MNFREALVGAVREAFCTSLSTADELWGRLGAPGTLAIPGFRLRASLGYRLVCNREPPPFPEPPSGGGGQCPIDYVVQGTYTQIVPQGNQCVPASNPYTRPFVRGPITGWTQVTRNGLTSLAIRGGPTPSVPDGLFLVGGSDPGSSGCVPTITSHTFLSITPQNPGQTDDCGEFPPLIPRPVSPVPPVEIPVDWEDDEGDSVTTPVNIRFAIPFIFINGQLNLPFQLSIPIELNVPIEGTFNLETGDVNFNFGGGSGGGGGGCLPKPPDGFTTPTPVPPPPPGTGIDPIDIPGDDSRLKTIIVGAIVTTEPVDGRATVIAQASNPDIYFPRVANLQFAIQIGNSVSWTERVSITSLRQFVPCPWEGGAIDVRITSEPGYDSFVTPVTAQVPDDNSYEVLN